MRSFLSSKWGRGGAFLAASALGLGMLLPQIAPVRPAAARAGELREFHLTVQPAKWEIAPGLVVDAWTYNGQVPGPELRVTEGDLVRVVVTNQLPVPTTVHWHGVDVPNAMDGVPGLTQYPIEPGETFVYEFPATNPGTRWYHSHQDSNAQLELGLFGPLIIEHLQDPNGVFDREHTYVFDEKALDFTPEVAMGQAQLRGAEFGNGRGGLPQFDLFLINGKAGEAIPKFEVREGERVRLRLINVGHLVHSIHLHGHSFKIIATDGNPVPPAGQWIKDSVTIGPSERYDVEVIAHNPGHWMFHCHMPNHQDNGMMTTIAYEGVEPVVPLVPHGISPALLGAPGPAPHPAGPAQAAPAQARASEPASAATEVEIVDNRFQPRILTVKAGTTVAWRSRGINLHTTTSFQLLWDSGAIPPGGTFSFTFTQPGTYNYFCRQHVLQGQIGQIVVE